MQRIKSRIVNLNLIIIGLLLIAANPKDSKYINEKLEIYPLNIGNSWTYQEYIYIEDSTLLKGDEIIIKVLNDTLINNNIYFLEDYDNILPYTLSINKENGYYSTETDFIEGNEQLLFKYPCKVGDRWRNKIVDGNTNYKSTTVVKALNKKITVPYGTMDCILYESVSKNTIGPRVTLYILYQHYLKPGLGIVKTITSHKNKINGKYKIKRYMELKTATIK